MMEELRDIKGYQGHYAATRSGKIWSHKRKKFLKVAGVPDNYQIVCLSVDGKCKCEYVHRLVALAWIDNPDNLPFVNHKDEHRHHNWADNLEWCDARYNINYGTRNEKQSRTMRGKKHKMSKAECPVCKQIFGANVIKKHCRAKHKLILN